MIISEGGRPIEVTDSCCNEEGNIKGDSNTVLSPSDVECSLKKMLSKPKENERKPLT